MKVKEKGHTIHIHDSQSDIVALVEKIMTQHQQFKGFNLIVDTSRENALAVKELKKFKPLQKLHTKGKKSFVLVVSDTDFTVVDEALNVVPTLLEAHDIIEMEEIERDLGF
uniref:ribonuclease Z n=1 Tax=Flavobacterium sp. TaxID=239 RepID=UPI00404B12FB